MPFCKVKNATIYYEDIGMGKPIIMLHGYSPDHRLMRGCMEPIFRVRDGWRRIYIDLPGMGQTKNYEHISSSDEMLEAVLRFIDTLLPNQSYVIAGESYGGYLTRGIIREQKEQIWGAAFICPVILPNKEERALPEHTIVYADDEFLSKRTKEEIADFSSHQVVLDDYNWDRYINEVLAGCKIADQQFLAKVQKKYGFSFSLEDVEFHKPSVFLLGKQDSIVGYQDTIKLLDKFSRGTFAVLDRAGHNLQIEQSALFHSLINEWLDRVEEFHNEEGGDEPLNE